MKQTPQELEGRKRPLNLLSTPVTVQGLYPGTGTTPVRGGGTGSEHGHVPIFPELGYDRRTANLKPARDSKTLSHKTKERMRDREDGGLERGGKGEEGTLAVGTGSAHTHPGE